jgi:uroporphyrinogen-III decarboxylase
MKTTMSSRERMLTAIGCGEPDHVPLWFRWVGLGNEETYGEKAEPRWEKWKDAQYRIKALLEMGLDESVLVHAPSGSEGAARLIETRCWRVNESGNRYPLLVKEYDTPEGPLRQIVRVTDDWPHGDDIPLLGDHNVSRCVEHAVETEQDVDKIKYLFAPPSAYEIAQSRERALVAKAFAEEHQVLLEGGFISLGDVAVWLCGVERVALWAVDRPDLLRRLLDIIFEWGKPKVEFLLDSGVDVVKHRAWYEIADFWGVSGYRRFLKPLLSKEVEWVHQAGAKFRYVLSKSVSPLLDDFLDLGIDALFGIDPVQDDVDLDRVKRRTRGRMCLYGGLNSAVSMREWEPDEISRAVGQAIEALAPGGGYVLSVVDSMYSDARWENFVALVEEWRRLGSYPI